MGFMTGNGKIARLPRAIRDELNRRMDDGQTGKELLPWLNGLPKSKTAGRTVRRTAHQQTKPLRMEGQPAAP